MEGVTLRVHSARRELRAVHVVGQSEEVKGGLTPSLADVTNFVFGTV